MNPSGILTVVFTAALGAPLLALLNFLFNRKRAAADIESVQVKTALDYQASLKEDIGALRAETNQQRKDIDELRRRERIVGRLQIRHSRWDVQAVEHLRAAGIDLPDPPAMDVDDEPDPYGPRTRASDYRREDDRK